VPGAGDAEAWGRALPGLRARHIPVLQAWPCRRGEDAEDATMEIFMKTEGQAGAVRRDQVVLRLALQGGGEPLLGYAAAAQDSSRQGNRRFGKPAAGGIRTPASWNG